jgi:hypothetical protein
MQTEVISFYSDIDNKTYYSDHASRLKKQLDDLKIPYDIREKVSLGSYQANCLGKPDFIYKLLIQKQKPVLWLDIDSDVRRSLDMFDMFTSNADIVLACSIPKLIGAKASPIFFNFNPKVLEFLQHWRNASRQQLQEGKWFDHESLMGLLHSYYNKEGFTMKFVGPQFCTWPGQEQPDSIIVMGLADTTSKKQALKNMGIDDGVIEWQSPGTK